MPDAPTKSTGRSFLKATALLAGGTAAGQIVVVAVSPIVSRLYPDPATWGTLAAFANILSCIAPIVCLRFEAAISVPEDETEADHLLMSSLGSSVIISALTGVFVLLAGSWLARVFHDPALPRYLWLLPLSLLGLGLYTSFSYWLIRRREFSRVGRTRVAQGLVQASCQVGLGLLKAGTTGLVLGDVLGRMVGGGTIALSALKSRQRTTWPAVLETAKRYRTFPLVSGPANLVHSFTTTFTMLLGPLYGAPALGFYFFGIRNLWAPVALVAQAMAQVYLGEASRWAREDPAHMLRSFDSIVRKLALLGIVPFGALVLAGGPITAFVFGFGAKPEVVDARFQAGVLAQIQAVSWWAMFVVGPILNTLNILQKQSWQLWCDASGLILMTVGFWMCRQYGWSLQTAVAIYSVIMTVMYGALYWCCRRAIVIAVADQAKSLA